MDAHKCFKLPLWQTPFWWCHVIFFFWKYVFIVSIYPIVYSDGHFFIEFVYSHVFLCLSSCDANAYPYFTIYTFRYRNAHKYTFCIITYNHADSDYYILMFLANPSHFSFICLDIFFPKTMKSFGSPRDPTMRRRKIF